MCLMGSAGDSFGSSNGNQCLILNETFISLNSEVQGTLMGEWVGAGRKKAKARGWGGCREMSSGYNRTLEGMDSHRNDGYCHKACLSLGPSAFHHG